MESRAHNKVRRRQKPQQIALDLNTWGGRRKGAGRPRAPGSGVSRRVRAAFPARHPSIVTVRLADIRSMRTGLCYRVFQRALQLGGQRPGFRVVEFSVLSNHLHLICEASDRQALARGMQGLLIRIAKGLNRALGRSGPVFEDRYHNRVLRTPTEVRNAIEYVLHNARKHARRAGRPKSVGWIDRRSSARAFFGLDEQCDPPLARARTWLMLEGWRRAGPIPIDGS